ncbi:hypothetical protein PGTUg99_016156 [Puccinia graminis f. sp. tritici]|uniref:Uncharacterized protein n=1 Tax=Puccinia graminis f. sp. tritici TaxID=56615 RepID=A0A5B0SJK2_PUCGR|nr:hypothetical protein PGTUg99_016156 [Puccinia graminis f. sp. tritici]
MGRLPGLASYICFSMHTRFRTCALFVLMKRPWAGTDIPRVLTAITTNVSH